MFVNSLWTSGLKLSMFVVFIPSIFVIVNAVLSAKTLGGELGKGLKKISLGVTLYVVLFLTASFQEWGMRGMLNDDQMRTYFMIVNVIASVFLMLGFLQIYKISKKLNLF